MTTGVETGSKWTTTARWVLLIWLFVALIQQYPKVLQQGFADFPRGLQVGSMPTGVSLRTSSLLGLLDRLEGLDGNRKWGLLVILPLPVLFERDLGRFDEFSPIGLDHLAHNILQLTYLGFPRKIDVAFLNSHGDILRVSHRWDDRLVPRVPVSLPQYEMIALPRDMPGLRLDRMEVEGETPDGEIVIYKRTDLR